VKLERFLGSPSPRVSKVSDSGAVRVEGERPAVPENNTFELRFLLPPILSSAHDMFVAMISSLLFTPFP
jgi:hypothetical protein